MAFAYSLRCLPAVKLISGGAHASALATTFTVLFLLWLFYRFSVQRNTIPRLPPGPFSLPIIGNLHLLKALPHRDLQELAKKYGPIMSLKLGCTPAVVVSSSAMAKEFLRTHDLVFASRPVSAVGKYLGYNYKDVIWTPYGPYWREMRKVCMVELLSAKRIKSFRSVREEEVSLAIRSMWEMSGRGTIPVNLSKILCSLTQTLMWRILSGKKYYSDENHLVGSDNGKDKEIREMISQIAKIVGDFNMGDLIPYIDWLDLQGIKRRMKKVIKSFDQIIGEIIDEHQQRRQMGRTKVADQETSTAKDIIDVLLEMEDETDAFTITIENIKAIVVDLIVAGAETTATTLEWAMSAVLNTPGVVEKLQQEIESVVGRERSVKESDLVSMEYLQCVVKETMRLYPAVPLLLPHESTQACVVNQYLIAHKTRIIVNAWAIGRDPSVWEDPLAFKPERFIGKNINIEKGKDYFEMVPFGAGRRGCPGSSMAVVTVELALAQLIHCFEWRVEGELDMSERSGGSMPRNVDLLALPALRLSGCP